MRSVKLIGKTIYSFGKNRKFTRKISIYSKQKPSSRQKTSSGNKSQKIEIKTYENMPIA